MAVLKTIEVVGTSDASWEDAAQNALTGASKTVRNIKWVEIAKMAADVKGNKISRYMTTLKLSFEVEG